eukprot:TRINITY_DN9889_c0_g1_i1.p1 TRINITY_DN9889_c0_g1~~TRINITY_DN9889_c0_g1_i1.p1  ORF type:complete len:121 (-),score=19.40 TRINITY_DN9889_c0_g1_i1:130-492(-)
MYIICNSLSASTRSRSQSYNFFFFFNDTATTEIYTLHIVGSVRCVQETGVKQQLYQTRLWHTQIRQEDQNQLPLFMKLSIRQHKYILVVVYQEKILIGFTQQCLNIQKNLKCPETEAKIF